MAPRKLIPHHLVFNLGMIVLTVSMSSAGYYAFVRGAHPSATDQLGGGNELLWQITGGTETMTVTRVAGSENQNGEGDLVLGKDLPVLPNNHGPQTDRLVYGLGPFQGYDSGSATSRIRHAGAGA